MARLAGNLPLHQAVRVTDQPQNPRKISGDSPAAARGGRVGGTMRLLAGAVAVIAALVVAAPASAAPLTAVGIRSADHPAFVRVVVEFEGGRVNAGEVVATDPNPFPDGVVRLPLDRAGVRTTVEEFRGNGVSVRITQGTGRIVIRLAARKHRFKYVHYRALHTPERLLIDLYKSRPPAAGAEIRRAPDRCLTLRDHEVTRRRVRASGRERDLFEHSLVVRLRRADGSIHRQRGETAADRRWSTSFRYRRTRRQTGTLEAVALSAKDGTLDCIVQARVRFGGS